MKNEYFDISQIETVTTVHFLKSLDSAAVPIIKAATDEWLRTGAALYIFDFKQVESVDRNVYRHLIEFGKFLLRHKKAATALNLHGRVEAEIKQTSLSVVLKPIQDIQEAKKFDLPNARPTDDAFVPAFIDAAKDCFADYFKTPIMDALVAYDWTPSEPVVDIGVASFVKSMDPGTYPSVLLGLPLSTFINVYENMFAETITDVTDEEADTIIELLNMLFGKVKGTINAQTGQKFEIQVPEFTSYQQLLKNHNLNNTRNSFIECTSPAGSFFILLIYPKVLKNVA